MNDPMIGLAIGRYIVRSKLAEGGMGAVYIAEHERLPNKRKVVKVLLGEFSRHEVIRQRFEREALAASRVKDEHVIDIDDFGALPDGQLFLMMPFVEGKPLDTHIQQSQRLSLHHTCHIVVQICLALDALHTAGLIHRDLKPGNILLSRTQDNPYFVKLIDLGIARDAADQVASFKTHTGMAMGTPGYMAVEQYADAASVTPASDLYALAIITWEMLTGGLPWGFHSQGVYFHVQQQPPPAPTGDAIPPDVIALLRRMLSPRVDDRLQSAREFAIALASLVPAQPPHVPSGAETLRRFAKRFTEHASPDLETVRAANSDPSRAVPMLWPQPQTPPPASQSYSTPQPYSSGMGSGPGIASLPQVSTANERPQPGAAPMTTLGSSAGVTSTTPPRGNRGMFALLALGLLAIAGGVGFIVTHRDRDGASQTAAQPEANPQPTPTVVPTDASPAAVVAAPAPPLDAAVDATATEVAASIIDAGTAAPVPTKTVEKRPKATSKTTRPRDTHSGSGNARGSAAALDPDAVAE